MNISMNISFYEDFYEYTILGNIPRIDWYFYTIYLSIISYHLRSDPSQIISDSIIFYYSRFYYQILVVVFILWIDLLLFLFLEFLFLFLTILFWGNIPIRYWYLILISYDSILINKFLFTFLPWWKSSFLFKFFLVRRSNLERSIDFWRMLE